MSIIGKSLILFGVIIILIGVILIFFDKIPYIGKLPGDINIKKDNFTVYIPITTCLIISVILTLLFYFFRK